MQFKDTFATMTIQGMAMIFSIALLPTMAWSQTPLGDPPPLVPGLQSPYAQPARTSAPAGPPASFNAPEVRSQQIQPRGLNSQSPPANGLRAGNQDVDRSRHSPKILKTPTVDCPSSNRQNCEALPCLRTVDGRGGCQSLVVRGYGSDAIRSFEHPSASSWRAHGHVCQPTELGFKRGW